MKVAMIGHKVVPSRSGGVEVVVSELAARMADAGHDVTVYNRALRGQRPGRARWRGVRVETVKTVDMRGLAAASSSYFATKAAVAGGFDVIHFHAEGPCVMMPLAKRAGARAVATIHGLDWRRAKWGRAGAAYIKRGERMAAEYADELIVLSRSMQGYFEGAYGREAHYIPNGIGEPRTLPPTEISKRWGLSKGAYLLYVGRIVPEKGLHTLLEAFASLATDKKLVVAGGPSDSEPYFERMKALAGGDRRVVFTGFVEGDLLAELYSNAYLYVMPSQLEGMPMTLLEAMSYGCCCLTSDIPECAEVLGDAGVTFRRGDSLDLRVALGVLLGDGGAARSIGQHAGIRARTHFDWDEVARETLAVYEEATDAR